MPPILDSLEIFGFRAFKSLAIENLRQVNLLVGKNNIGKTSILEALKILFSSGNSESISAFLTSREEYSFRRSRNYSVRDGIPLAAESLFFGRPGSADANPCFEIRQAGGRSPSLRVELTWLRQSIDDFDKSIKLEVANGLNLNENQEVLPGFQIFFGNQRKVIPLSRFDRNSRLFRPQSEKDLVTHVLLPSNGLDKDEIGKIWDTVALTEDEDGVIKILNVIAPGLEKLVLVQGPDSRRDRIMMGKMMDFDEPVPFRSLGEGMHQILGLFLSMIKARDGVILIDEVERGIHYSRQGQIWDFIIRQAIAWNIQVFATTHSWDCVVSFQESALRNDVSCMLFRLEGSGGEVRGVPFSPEEISIAAREHIEVR